ncbi:hypothetical protein, partial [Xanthomonas euvesicatoria]|uniref:hypothetical protein n=1 Tax=Xanthomonas euvesicatoria TaxID=456327 RepID=UPI0032B5EB48
PPPTHKNTTTEAPAAPYVYNTQAKWGGAAALAAPHVLDCAAFKAIISTLPGAVPRHCGTVGGINVAIDSRDG